jgi:hypothetical protein
MKMSAPAARIRIERLRLHLPQGFAPRADNIARQVAERLAQLPIDASSSHVEIRIPTVQVQSGQSNHIIAGRIATALHRQLNNRIR